MKVHQGIEKVPQFRAYSNCWHPQRTHGVPGDRAPAHPDWKLDFSILKVLGDRREFLIDERIDMLIGNWRVSLLMGCNQLVDVIV